MGGPGHGPSAPPGSDKFGGFRPPHVSNVHKRLAVFMGATCWLWMMYRAKQDGDVLLVRVPGMGEIFLLNNTSSDALHQGMRKPWEHKGHHEKDPEFD
jgi:hypothetical protein